MLTLSYISRLLKSNAEKYKGINKILLVAFDRQKMSYQNLSGQFLYITLCHLVLPKQYLLIYSIKIFIKFSIFIKQTVNRQNYA